MIRDTSARDLSPWPDSIRPCRGRPRGAEAHSRDCRLPLAFLTWIRLWAEQSPPDLKDALKRRGYRWSDVSDDRPRSRYLDVDESRLEDEISFSKPVPELFAGRPLSAADFEDDQFSNRLPLRSSLHAVNKRRTLPPIGFQYLQAE